MGTRPPKRKTERAPPVDRLLKPAIGVVLAMMAYLFMQGLQYERYTTSVSSASPSALPALIQRVDVEDELALRDVFFGEGDGKNYVVLCHSPPTDDKSASIPLSSVFQDAKNEGSVKAEFVLLDCNHVLPSSNKTIADRFGLDLKKRPTIFVSGKTGAPKQVPLKHLKTGNMLLKVLRGLLEPHAAKIENTKGLKTKCLSKDMCALLLKGGPVDKYTKEAIQNLIVEYPQVQFASVDSTVLLLTNLENSDVTEFSRGQHRLVMFKKVSGTIESPGDNNTDTSRLITSIAAYGSRNFQYSPMGTFIQSAVKGSKQFSKLPALPVVKTRTKKIEEQERKKWQRARERKERERQSAAGGGGGAFTSSTDDGSKEARKAERDRLREQHHKEHNIKELTPEEIAERERSRRMRMEEEAAKWNIMPEDAPPEGEKIEEEEIFDMDQDEDDGTEGEESDDEEEDVMDLD